MLKTKPNRLQKAMSANALFSFFSGMIFLLAQDFLIPHIPMPALLWTLFGVGLIAFSAQLLFMVKNPARAEKLIVSVVFSDIAWVILTFIALAYYQERISAPATALIIGINITVTALAWFQAQGYLEQRRK
ncbi:hypothetical protein SG35_008055 [Thalassomonas actiniarum]|uniref:Uncharacterized protein n=2 Tax=Thalassomonas actiniarum TaxID=485447 RepID=A0AAE9YTN9_9GAMM|nr:hypothetical protein SG35_008055 [Thalassomonas actiniarum]